MAISKLFHSSAVQSVTDAVVTGQDSTGCDFLVAAAAWYPGGGNPHSFTDNKSNSWTEALRVGAAAQAVIIYYSIPTSVGSSHSFTFDSTGSETYPTLMVAGFSGVKQTSPKDQESSASAVDAALVKPGTITPTEAGELCLTALAHSENKVYSIDVGDILAQVGNVTAVGGAFAYLIQTSAAAFDPTWSWTTNTPNSYAISVSFKAAASGPTLPVLSYYYNQQ